MDKFIRKEQMRKHVKHSKSDKAITLIALIVIIIILLILAGVVINLALNHRGLFSHAKIAVKKWNESEGNEKQSLQDVVDYIDGMKGIKERIDSDVKKALEYADSMGAEEDDTVDPTPGILDGDGTESNPYKIQSIEDLVAFSYNVNSGTNTYKDKTVMLQRNLHFDGSYNSYANPNAKYEVKTSTPSGNYDIGYIPNESASKTIKELVTTDKGFIPISAVPVDGRTFEGNFDGGNHRLVGLYEKADNYGGLFGWITSPIKISNLAIRDGNICANSESGGVVGVASSDIAISNCYNAPLKTDNLTSGGIIGMINSKNGNKINATMSHCYNIGANKLGGIIGYVPSNDAGTIMVDNCYNTGDVKSTSSFYQNAGGIIGFGYGTVIATNCYNTGVITGENVGGIISHAFGKLTATECYNTGNITGSGSSSYSAGVIGMAHSEATIEKCYNTGAITGEYTGGITSHVFGKLTATECYNTGNITGSSSESGGVIGMAHSDATIENCHNTGKVDVGSGIVSQVSGNATVTDCSNTGAITGEYTGGIIGQANSNSDATIQNCHNIGNVTGSDAGGIVGEGGKKVTNCYNTGKITGSNAGGIIGHADSDATIEKCYNTGNVTGSGSSSTTGGICGGFGSTARNCYNTGDITGNITGGIVGSGSTATKCYNTGKITGDNLIGGIMGSGRTSTDCYNTGTIKGKGQTGGIMANGSTATNCYNTGDVTGESGNTGGIIANGSTATNCYNTGNITLEGNSENNTGGIMANGSTVTNCFNKGMVKGAIEGDRLTGGIIGYGSTAINCYNTGDVTSKSLTGGIIGGGGIETVTNCYNTGTITGTGSSPTGGILSYGESNKSNNCHNTGDIKMNTPNPEIMFEIGGADNTCTYLLKSTNAQPENAIGKNESEMKQIMDLNKFIELMNKKVEENNSDSKNTKLKKWELKDQMPVFSNN